MCCCCDDCRGCFLYPDEICDKGKSVESTGAGGCTDRGLREEVCYLGARRMEDGKLSVDRERSFGCALCLDACPEECTWMVTRT